MFRRAIVDYVSGRTSFRIFYSVFVPAVVLLLGTAPAEGDSGSQAEPGTDVIVGDLFGTAHYGEVNGIHAYSIATTSCNIGDEELEWQANNNLHPVIAQNLFRLHEGRFEQIGQSWLKHGFCALQLSLCGPCTPAGGGCFTRLGVGCSDPYGASLNGIQGLLGPRFEVNPATGVFPYPFSNPNGPTGDAIFKRIQVRASDLTVSGALYFIEGHYIHQEDAQAGNGNNNASYRRVTVNGSFSLTLQGSTEREKAAILAWLDHGSGVDTSDPDVTIVEVDVPDDGRFLVAYKVSDNGDGTWHYEYAVQNLNSHRSGGSLTIPVGATAIVSNTGFHDVDYHSGEPFDNSDWSVSVMSGSVTWSSPQTHAQNSNSNALRWGTLYNFRFDAYTPPEPVVATLGLFRPGFPDSVTVPTLGPSDSPDAVCTPTPDQSACEQVICSNGNNSCVPVAGAIDPDTGADIVLECKCLGPDDCHLEFGVASLTCAGSCPDQEEQCNLVGSDPFGDGLSCMCGPPTRPCCVDISDGPIGYEGCRDLDEDGCADVGGLFQGGGTTCTGSGACCLSTGFCGEAESNECCEASGGVYGGVGSTCDRTGGCCLDLDGDGINETCEVTSEVCCTALGGAFHGAGTTCGDEGACCFGFAGVGCVVAESTCCADILGTFHGNGSTCEDGDNDGTPDVCLAPVEVCPQPDPPLDFCAHRQNTDCVNLDPSDELCQPRTVRIALVPPGPELFTVTECDCFLPDEGCGPVLIDGNTLSCGSVCSNAMGLCQIFINGLPTNETSVDVTEAVPGDFVACNCACAPSSRPEPELFNNEVNAKNRYLSIKVGAPGRRQAIRARFAALPPPFDIWEFDHPQRVGPGDYFVGAPFKVCENSGQGIDTLEPCDPAGTLPRRWFWGAPLLCDKSEAHFMDWHGQCVAGACVGGLISGSSCSVDADCADVVHLFHEGVIPEGVYDIQVIGDGCSLDDEDRYSVALTVTQGKWGDICGPGPGGACTAVADGNPQVIQDVLGLIDKFQNINALQKSRADLVPGDDGDNNGPDFKITIIGDALFALDAFQGFPYPFTPGDPCAPDQPGG